MKAALSQVRWDLVLKASVLVYTVTLILGLALSLFLPAFLDPDHTVQAAALMTALLIIGVTGYGAWRVARLVAGAALVHGFLVGLVVALISFILDLAFRGEINPVGLVLYVLMVAAGVLGGILGSRR